MNHTGLLLADIREQPQSWLKVLHHQRGEGRISLSAAAESARQARRLILSGMGASHFACISLNHQLAQHGLASWVIDTSELLHHQHRAFGRGDVVILVSRSGETVEAIKLLPLLKDRGVSSIGITNVAGSTLASQADRSLLIAGGIDHLGVAIQSYTSTLLCLHLLGESIVAPNRNGTPALRDDWIPQASLALDGWVEASRSWRPFLQDVSAIHLLARGASMASALEGAILFNEIAKVAAIPMGASLFRHGPVEVVDKNFRAIVFVAPEPTRSLDLSLAGDLINIGVTTRWIGSEAGAPASVGPFCWGCPAVPAALAPIVEILPIQIAAMRMAEWRNLQIGQFRIAGPVTLSEIGFQTQPGFVL